MKKILLATLSYVFLTQPVFADLQKGVEALSANKFEEAADQFTQSMEDGEADGAYYLGRMLELGLGTQSDPNAALRLYQASASNGSNLAKNRLGMMHLEGRGVLQDFEEGARLVCEAADAGEVNGQFNCALVLLEGRGVEADPKKAVEHLDGAVKSDHVGAKNMLAQILITGELVEKDEKRAVELIQQTASVGNPVGLFSLAQAFAVGLGVDQDSIKAHAYFNLASARNHPDADQARRAIEQRMTKEQVIEAQRMARTWRSKTDAEK